MKRIILTALSLILSSYYSWVLRRDSVGGPFGAAPVGVEVRSSSAASFSFQSSGWPNEPNSAFERRAHRRSKDFQDELRWLPRITRSTEPMEDSKFLSACSAIRG